MSEYRIVKRSGSLDLSREVQTLVEQLCLESKSDLEVKYTRVLEAEKQAKDMLSVYKSAQKLKETYRMTTGMEKVWKELREREEKNGGKPLESGSKLSQEWVTQVVRIMKDYKSCFPKVGSSSLYLLEISERSCKDLSSLKRSVEELKKAGVVKEVYWDHKSYHETLEYLQLDPGRIESYLRGRKESSKKEFEESARVCLSELQRDGWERYQSKSCNNVKEKTLLEVLKGWHKSKNTGVMGHWEIFSSMTEGGVNPLLEKLRLTGPEDVKCYVQSHKEVIPNVLGSYFAPRAKEEHKKVQEKINEPLDVKLANVQNENVAKTRAKLEKLERYINENTEYKPIKFGITSSTRLPKDQYKIMIEKRMEIIAKWSKEERELWEAKEGIEEMRAEKKLFSESLIYLYGYEKLANVMYKYEKEIARDPKGSISILAQKMKEEIDGIYSPDDLVIQRAFKHVYGKALDVSIDDLKEQLKAIGKAGKFDDLKAKMIAAAGQFQLHINPHGVEDNYHLHIYTKE